MALNAEQRAELEALGPGTVRMKLLQSGPGKGAAMAGFKSGVLGHQDTRVPHQRPKLTASVIPATALG
jgi:hypothetical protein